jgi:hypothetical protein
MNVNIPDQTIRNLISLGIEQGGIRYWGYALRSATSPKWDWETWPLLEGSMEIHAELSDWDPSEEPDFEPITLTYESFEEALQLMADKYEWHFSNAVDDSRSDIETGDVFMQLACFGEIVYG